MCSSKQQGVGKSINSRLSVCSSKQQGVGKSITVGCLCAAQNNRALVKV